MEEQLNELKRKVANVMGIPKKSIKNEDDDKTVTEVMIHESAFAKMRNGEQYRLIEDDSESVYMFYDEGRYFKQTIDWRIFRDYGLRKSLKTEQLSESEVKKLILSYHDFTEDIKKLNSTVANPPKIK